MAICTTVEEPMRDKPIISQPTVKEPETDEPREQEPTMHGSTMHRIMVEGLTMEEPTLDHRPMHKPAIEDSAKETPPIEKPTTGKRPIERHPMDQVSDKELWEEILTAERQIVIEDWYKSVVKAERRHTKHTKTPGYDLLSKYEATTEGSATNQAERISGLDTTDLGLSNNLQQEQDQRPPRLVPPKSIYRPIGQIAASDVPSLHKIAHDLIREDPRFIAVLMLALATNDHSNLAGSMLIDSYAEHVNSGGDMDKTTERLQHQYYPIKSIGAIGEATIEATSLTRRQYHHRHPRFVPIPMIRGSMRDVAGEFKDTEKSFETVTSALENLCKIGNAMAATPDSLGVEMKEVFQTKGDGSALLTLVLKVLKLISPEQAAKAVHEISEVDDQMLLSGIRRLSVKWGICGLKVDSGFAKVTYLLEHGVRP